MGVQAEVEWGLYTEHIEKWLAFQGPRAELPVTTLTRAELADFRRSPARSPLEILLMRLGPVLLQCGNYLDFLLYPRATMPSSIIDFLCAEAPAALAK